MSISRQLEELDRQWRQAAEGSAYSRRTAGQGGRRRYWNQQAAEYDDRMAQDFRRVDHVLRRLTGLGLLARQSRVLDLGCGTGTYAIELAKRAGQVLALDLSPQMGGVLEEKARVGRLPNIRFLQGDWDSLDLEKEGLAGWADVTLSGLNPAIAGVEALGKMCRSARKACCLVVFAGPAENPVRRDLEQLFSIPKNPAAQPWYTVEYPMRALFGMGYLPELSYTQMDWVKKHPFQEAVKRLEEENAPLLEGKPALREGLREYVRQHLGPDGCFRETNKARLGVIIWRVDGEPDQTTEQE